MHAGTNDWTCIVDIPDTPGNTPLRLNDTYLEVLLAQRHLVDGPSTGIGFGYMLQSRGPVGSPPHMMVFVPGSNEYWRRALAPIEEPDNWGRLSLPLTGWIHIRMGEVLYEWNELRCIGRTGFAAN